MPPSGRHWQLLMFLFAIVRTVSIFLLKTHQIVKSDSFSWKCKLDLSAKEKVVGTGCGIVFNKTPKNCQNNSGPSWIIYGSNGKQSTVNKSLDGSMYPG